MKSKRTLTIATVLVALAVLLTLGVFPGMRKVQAQDQIPPPINDPISFGMVGITQGQTARINVSNVIAQNDSSLPPGPTRVVIIIHYKNGEVFRNRDGSPVRRVVMLDPGESAFLDLNFDNLLPPPTGDRIQFRAAITEEPPPTGDIPPPTDGFPAGPYTVQTVEVINNSNGRTQFVLSAPPVIRQIPPPIGE